MRYEQVIEISRKNGRPIRLDDDYICNICGEPWDARGIYDGDMLDNEKRRFLKGLGCPCCPRYEEQR